MIPNSSDEAGDWADMVEIDGLWRNSEKCSHQNIKYVDQADRKSNIGIPELSEWQTCDFVDAFIAFIDR